MVQPLFFRRILLISCVLTALFMLGGCKEDPVATTTQTPQNTVKVSPLAGYWKAQLTIPLAQVNGALDVILSEQPNKEVRGSGYAFFDIPAGALTGTDPNQEIPFKLAQPLQNCSAAFNADSTVNLDAGVLDLSLLAEMGGGGVGSGLLKSLPVKMQNATLSADKKTLSGTIQFLFFPLQVNFVKQ